MRASRLAAAAALLALVGCQTQPHAPTPPAAQATASPAGDTATVSADYLLAGKTNPAVTPDTIHSTICVSGYTAKIRPPSSVTSKVRREMAAAEHVDPTTVVLDHLVPLEGGGAPGSVSDWRNFLLQPKTESHKKDRLENEMRADICSGRVPLREAQVAMADGWQDYAEQVGDR